MSVMTKPTVLLLGSLMLLGTAMADEAKPNREREALRRAQQQLQQTQQELAATKDKVLAAERDGELVQKELQSAKSRARVDGQKAAQLQTALEEAQKQVQVSQAEKAELDKRLAQTQAELSRTQHERTQTAEQVQRLQAELTVRTRDINSCQGKNQELYKSGRELIAQCQIQAVDGADAARLPATGMKRVAIENLLESYRDKLDEQRLSNASKSP